MNPGSRRPRRQGPVGQVSQQRNCTDEVRRAQFVLRQNELREAFDGSFASPSENPDSLEKSSGLLPTKRTSSRRERTQTGLESPDDGEQ